MKKCFLLIIVSLLSVRGFSQKPDTLIKKLDSLSRQKDSAGNQINNTDKTAFNEQTKITFKTYFILLGSTLKQEFTKPLHMKGKDWRNLGIATAATAALCLVDEPLQQRALKFRASNTWALKASKYITNTGGVYELITLGSLFSYGLIFKNEKLRTTTLLASQAYATGISIATAVKYVAGRTRPSYYDLTVEAEPDFKGPFKNNGNNSFPSGHSTVAFAAATVYAMEYRSTVWVPIVAYSVATAISATRITENKHWTTDVFVGALLGYVTGRHVVNNYHRYAKLKAPSQPKNSVTYNLQYSNGHFMPGLVYHIR